MPHAQPHCSPMQGGDDKLDVSDSYASASFSCKDSDNSNSCITTDSTAAAVTTLPQAFCHTSLVQLHAMGSAACCCEWGSGRAALPASTPHCTMGISS